MHQSREALLRPGRSTPPRGARSCTEAGDRPACPTSASLIDVTMILAGRSLMTCVFPVQRSARRRLDNCFRDQAVTNAAQLADLLSGADVPVASPIG
jgi:hypothetical protein